MNIINEIYKTKDNNIINYYEIKNNNPLLIMIHGQGTNSNSFKNVINKLSKKYHIYLIDCYGHGKSSKNKEKYNLIDQSNDIIEFINEKKLDNINILGHSSGALIATYIANKSSKIKNLILEDPPFFTSCGEQRKNAYNYKDLSTVCHNYIESKSSEDFLYYYFINQYCWNFFPEESRDKIKNKLGEFAKKYREKNPDKTLKVPFWPKKFLKVFDGLNEYDPYFGEAFYTDSFNKNVDYEELLKNLNTNTILLKANTTIGENGLIQGAMSDLELEKVKSLIKNLKIIYINSGHGIHDEKPKEFIKIITK